jgi:hypothetical protein
MKARFVFLWLKHQDIWKQRTSNGGSGKEGFAVVQLICIGLCELGLQLKFDKKHVSDRGMGFWDLRDECSNAENVCVTNISKHQCRLLSTINISQRIFTISHFPKTTLFRVFYTYWIRCKSPKVLYSKWILWGQSHYELKIFLWCDGFLNVRVTNNA